MVEKTADRKISSPDKFAESGKWQWRKRKGIKNIVFEVKCNEEFEQILI